MLDKIVCYNPDCKRIPSIKIDQEYPFIEVNCSIHKNKRYPIKYYLDLCQNGSILTCQECFKKLPNNNFIFYCINCKKYLDSKCFYATCFKKGHKSQKKKLEEINSGIVGSCKHNKGFIKYCKNCDMPLCKDCLGKNNNHINHELQEIKVKSTNDLNVLKNILDKQEEIFEKQKNLILEYLEELKNKLKIKRAIFENYKNNKFNLNALKNLENLNLMINIEYLNKIVSKKVIDMNSDDKSLSLYYFNKMISDESENKLNEANKKENKFIDIDINKKNYLEDDKNKNNIKIYPNGNLIKRISEKSKIYSLLVLESNNLALGFSNGFIKIYKNDLFGENNFQSLLTINKFKGRRINYLHQLKDKTLLCCTFSKIHHIALKNSDSGFDYLGTIKLTSYEIPKKIIELGDNLIVSLGEKNFKKKFLNSIQKKCILKIFNKINNNENKNQEEYLSDNESLNSINSLSSDWESVFSNELEKNSSESEELIEFEEYEDKYIKIYKNNKNADRIFLCTIFATQTSEKDNYKFVASSNKKFKGGENLLSFYGIVKDKNSNKYLIYLENEKIDKIACSQNVDSICFLDKDIIGVALQNFEESDFDGIAIVNIKKRKLEKIIGGLSIGIINMNIINNKKNIFFFTNNGKDIKKIDTLVISEYDKNKKVLENEGSNVICTLKTSCRGGSILKNSNNIKNNVYYIIYTFEDVFILEIKI